VLPRAGHVVAGRRLAFSGLLSPGSVSKSILLLKTNMTAGHGGASGRYDALKETAFTYAFLLSQLGIK
jgi:protease II